LEIGSFVSIDHGTYLYPSLRTKERPGVKIVIGDNVFINVGGFVAAGLRIDIESNVMIGPYCFIADADHGIDPSVAVANRPLQFAPIRIRDGAWLGAHVSVLKGVTIGRNAVIGAGAVVTRDVPDGAVFGGIPAHSLRR
jgi:acetyltransferase-like isoleucine patch superfamily enzyme